jgi:uncharacterized protein with ParB-like and HNH nuclease domain
MKGIQNTSTENFSTILGNNKKFRVPKFQRDYSWDTEQWDDLWLDIDYMIRDDSDHYMGYLVLQTTNNRDYLIIDGQQRFTTITLIILAGIKSIQNLVDKGIDKEDNGRRISNLMNTYIGNEDPVSLDYDNILVLNRNNNGYYKDYIVKLSDLKVRNIKTTEKLMKRGFEFFESKLNGLYSAGEEYASFIQKVVERLFFTLIVVNDEMNAFRVFETLNARGVQLSSSDLLKNYLFSLVDVASSHEGRIDTLEEKWSKLTNNIRTEKLPEFLRYFWNSSHKSIRSNEVFKTIRNEIVKDTQVFSMINEMIEFSDIYMALNDSNDEMWANEEEIIKNVSLMNLFNLKQPYSVLMAAHKYLDISDFKKLLKIIIDISFRYNVICGKNPNEIERAFNEVAISISSSHLLTLSPMKKIYVEDSEFKSSFKMKSFVSNSRNTKIIRYILDKIERFKGGQISIDINDDNNSIEHILPQSPNGQWQLEDEKFEKLTDRLGNLCLLKKSLNKDLGNKGFDDKKLVYATSAFITTADISAKFDHWDENAINSRQADMGKAAEAIWKVNF